MFDRVYCVNLDRRPERWRAFQERLPADWPFAEPERWAAVDGSVDAKPGWYRATQGAWGCLQSHRAIWRHAMEQHWGDVLVLEDDAVFRADFSAKAARFLDAVPDDWDQLYFGGQHLEDAKHPPVSTDGICVRCYNVNRTHCYAIRPALMKAAHDALAGPPQEPCRRNQYHVDHRFGAMHKTGEWNVYAPYRFVVGQAAGPSDVGCSPKRALFWEQHPVAGVPELPLCCAVATA